MYDREHSLQLFQYEKAFRDVEVGFGGAGIDGGVPGDLPGPDGISAIEAYEQAAVVLQQSQPAQVIAAECRLDVVSALDGTRLHVLLSAPGVVVLAVE